MNSLRLVPATEVKSDAACRHCQATGCPWDRIAGKPICTDCQERLIAGAMEPQRIEAEESRCALCARKPTLRFLTFPLCDPDPIEIHLCGDHLRALLGRKLGSRAYRKLRQSVNEMGFAVEQFFLLHEAFYDEDGLALQPLQEPLM